LGYSRAARTRKASIMIRTDTICIHWRISSNGYSSWGFARRPNWQGHLRRHHAPPSLPIPFDGYTIVPSRRRLIAVSQSHLSVGNPPLRRTAGHGILDRDERQQTICADDAI